MSSPQVPVPGQPQAPVPGTTDPAAAPAPVEGNDAWPPDSQTLIQMMMDARFSIIDEPAGDVATDGADRQSSTPAGTPPPQPQAQG